MGEHRAFYGCESLISIVIPPSITSIGQCAFTKCESLTSIVIPCSVTYIGDRAFSDCRSLNNIVIPASDTLIGDWAEYGDSILLRCNLLRSIDITLPLKLEEHYEQNLLAEAIESIEEWVEDWDDMSYTSDEDQEELEATITMRQDGRLALFTAAAVSMKWKGTERIYEANKIAIYNKNVITGLSPFMLAAVGMSNHLESVYHLCREYPVAIIL